MTTTTKTKRTGRRCPAPKKQVKTPSTRAVVNTQEILLGEELKPTDAARECGMHKDTFLKMVKDSSRWPWPVIRRSKRGPGSLGIPRSSIDSYKRSLVKVGGGQ